MQYKLLSTAVKFISHIPVHGKVSSQQHTDAAISKAETLIRNKPEKNICGWR